MIEEDDRTPIERPLLRSDLNEIRDIVHGMDTMLVRWYEENKLWRQQSDELAKQSAELVKRVVSLERRVWVPTVVSAVAAVIAILARLVP